MSSKTSEEIKTSLIEAGIGDRFATMKLSDFGEIGNRFVDAFAPGKKKVKSLLKHGLLLYLHGIGAREFALTLAGGLLLGYEVRTVCLHLSELADLLDNQFKTPEEVDDVADSDVLVVTDFLNTSSICPLDARTAFRVEAFLLRRMENEGKTLILAGDGKFSTSNWWSSVMKARVNDSFIQETISVYASPRSSTI